MVKIILSGEIGWDIWPDDIRDKLNAAKGDDIEVHIASPGGGVMDGIEIFNMFRDYKRDYPDSQIMAIIKGMAASMASYIAVNPSFDLIAAEDNAVFMIHNAWGRTSGDYREMKLFSEILEGLTGIIGKAYSQKTKNKISKIREMMDSETWLFGEEIAEAGFVDEIIKTEDEKNKPTAIINAKTKFSKLSKKIDESENKIDIQKIAAMIKPENPEPEPKQIQNTNNAQTPAQNAGKNITEVMSMTLAELLAQNPAAKIEHENALKVQFDAGEKSGQEKMEINMKYAAPFLNVKSEYPDKIKAVVVKFLEGSISRESLEIAVTMYDAEVESKKSDDAKDESEKTGDTPGDQPPNITEDGTIQNEADFTSEVNRTKSAIGMEV